MSTEKSIKKSNYSTNLTKRLENCIIKAEERKEAFKKITKSIQNNNVKENK